LIQINQPHEFNFNTVTVIILSNAQMPNSPRTNGSKNQQWTNQQNLKWNNRMMGNSKVSNGNSREKIAKKNRIDGKREK
jgi:hypothetical protein